MFMLLCYSHPILPVSFLYFGFYFKSELQLKMKHFKFKMNYQRNSELSFVTFSRQE
jgi:hypothetical protein